MEDLKPCPFCSGEVEIGFSDDEGNRRSQGYVDNPWSGLTFVLLHNNEDNPECPIAHFEDEQLGTLLYDTREEAIEAWNKG